ncbi:hypothetical protein DBZ36_03490 [Alginatibacterium sediminis]|uniref:Peptidoglycan-binding protein CsiV n=1 Tax=Alginatibacterium sediminis TaxID=2164068 RepID=A0A420EFR3_9ALTE|nr:CsiV family protein [Alginatibacterium sediminis]RKF19542.1 hypothetical protein DBZ36_03490 [Alginatibacterium sediminis]
MQTKQRKPLGLFTIISLFVLLSSSLSAFARPFTVEMIVFKRTDGLRSTAEKWPQPQYLDVQVESQLLAPLYGCSDASCLQSLQFTRLPTVINGKDWPAYGPTNRRVLSSSSLRLKRQYNSLRTHAGFTPMLHIAWRETVLPKHRAQHNGFQAGENFADRDNNDGIELSQVINDALASTNQNWEIDGSIRVYLQHYLYIEAQMLLKQEVTKQIELEPVLSEATNTSIDSDESNVVVGEFTDIIETPTQTVSVLESYKFDQKRRVKSDEVHYFDHPLMGLVIQIRK